MDVFTFTFCIKFLQNSVDPDQTPRIAASMLGLQCFQMFPKWGSGLKLVELISLLIFQPFFQ